MLAPKSSRNTVITIIARFASVSAAALALPDPSRINDQKNPRYDLRPPNLTV